MGGDIVDATEEVWDTTFDICVKGMFFMCKYAIPKMIEGGGGSIINISSITSIRPLGGSVAYTTAKDAVNTLTIYIARRYARYNIRANDLILGYMDTPSVASIWQDEKIREINLKQVPMRRFGSPWEGATAAVFFASTPQMMHHMLPASLCPLWAVSTCMFDVCWLERLTENLVNVPRAIWVRVPHCGSKWEIPN